MFKNISLMVLVVIAYLLLTGTVWAQTYNPSSISISSDSDGEFIVGVGFPWTVVEQEYPPMIGVDVCYLHHYEEGMDLDAEISDSIFVASIYNKEPVIVPNQGFLIVRPVLGIINPLGWKIYEIDHAVHSYRDDEIEDLIYENGNGYLVVDLSQQLIYVDIGVLVGYEDVLENHAGFWGFDDHQSRGMSARFRVLVNNTDPVDNDIDLLSHFAGGYSPKYGFPVNFAIMSLDKRMEAIDNIKKVLNK